MNKKTKSICTAAIIAALYAVLTYISGILGLASGAVQVRLSEALCVLPYFTPAAIPGLAVGCLLSNIFAGVSALDIVFGPLATLVGAYGGYLLRKNKWLVPIPTILSNAVIIPLVLCMSGMDSSGYGIAAAGVAAGEIISCGGVGMLLIFALEKRKNDLFG